MESRKLEDLLKEYLRLNRGSGVARGSVRAAEEALLLFQAKRPDAAGALMDGDLAQWIGGKKEGSGGLAQLIILFGLLCLEIAQHEERNRLVELVGLARRYRGSKYFMDQISVPCAEEVARIFGVAARKEGESLAPLVNALSAVAKAEPTLFALVSSKTLQVAFAEPYPFDPAVKKKREDQRNEVLKSLALKLIKIRGIL